MKGKNLSLFDLVYRELDSTFIGAERPRNVKAKRGERYDYASIRIDCENIIIKAGNSSRLDFAQRVAEYYGATYTRGEEAWRRDPEERFFIKIRIEE